MGEFDKKTLSTVSDIELLEDVAKESSFGLLERVLKTVPEVVDELFNKGIDVWIVVTGETQENWRMSSDRLRFNYSNCKGYNLHENGTIDLDISINRVGGWRTLNAEDYKFIGIDLYDSGHLVELTSLVTGVVVEKLVNRITNDVQERLGVLKPREEIGVTGEEGNVVSVNFGKRS